MMQQHPCTDVPFDMPGYLLRVGYLVHSSWTAPKDVTGWLKQQTDDGDYWQKPTPTMFTYKIYGATPMGVWIIDDDYRLRNVGISKDQYKAYAYTTLRAAVHSFHRRKIRQRQHLERTLANVNILLSRTEKHTYEELSDALRLRSDYHAGTDADTSVAANITS